MLGIGICAGWSSSPLRPNPACVASAQLRGSSGSRRERDNIRAALAWAVEQGRAADAVDDRRRVRVRLVHQRRDQRRACFDHPGPWPSMARFLQTG